MVPSIEPLVPRWAPAVQTKKSRTAKQIPTALRRETNDKFISTSSDDKIMLPDGNSHPNRTHCYSCSWHQQATRAYLRWSITFRGELEGSPNCWERIAVAANADSRLRSPSSKSITYSSITGITCIEIKPCGKLQCA